MAGFSLCALVLARQLLHFLLCWQSPKLCLCTASLHNIYLSDIHHCQFLPYSATATYSDIWLLLSITRGHVCVGSADVQDSADISAVSEPAHLVAHQRTQYSIVVRPTAVRAISTDIIRQAIVQHCRTSDLELTATCCVKLRLSLYFQIQT